MLETISSLWDELAPTLKAYKAEVDVLRSTPGPVREDEQLDALYTRLVLTRRCQDRLEAIAADLGMVRSRCKIAVSEAQDAYDDRWREVMINSKVGEYSSAQERNATYTAGAVNELVHLRRAKRMLADVDEIYDYSMFKFRGLDSSRRDTESRIRMLNVESMLER